MQKHGTLRMSTRLVAGAMALAVAASPAACGRSDAAVRETVVRYNETLTDAYKRPDPDLMTRLTGAKEKKRITMYILYQLKQGRILRVTLNRLSFKSVSVRGNRATAKTEEDWVFQHLDKDTRRVLDKPRRIHYEATYRLLFTRGRWVIDSLLVEESPVK